ncbi:MAG: methyl-accepting chemotaxis protein [Exilispira sp.]
MTIKGKILIFNLMFFIILIVIVVLGLISYEKDQTEKIQLNYLQEKSEKVGSIIARRIENSFQIAKSMADIFKDFEEIPVRERRTIFKNDLLAILKNNEHLLGVFTAWEPNALDNLDSEYAGKAGYDLTGRFLPYFSRYSGKIEYSCLVDYDKPGVGDWYILPVQKKEEMIIGPYEYQVGDVKKTIISLVIPIIKNDKVLGVAGVDLDIQFISDILDNIKLFKTGFIRLLNSQGIIIYHKDKERIGKLWDAEIESGKDKVIFQKMLSNENYIDQIYSIALKTYTIKSFSPVFIEKVKDPWIIGFVITEKELYQDLYNLIFIIVIIAFITIIISFIVINILSKIIVKPINIVNRKIEDIATGEGDLTKKLDIKSKDEVENLAKNLNIFIDKIKNIVLELISINGKSRQLGENLASITEQTSATIEEIASTIKSMSDKTLLLNKQMENTSYITQNISKFIENVNEMTLKQHDSISLSSSAIEQMVASINSLEKTLENKYKQIIELKNITESGEKSMKETITIIKQINSEAESIIELVNIINNISDQTNLLAMNAAIEAAHAGEFGKGFSVVADEIRKLAESTGENSKTISINLKKIVDEINKSNEATQQTGNQMDLIIKGTEDMALSIKEFLESMKELTQGTKQILESLTLLKSISNNVSNGIVNVKKEIEAINNNIKEVFNFVTETNNGMNEISSAMNDLSNAAIELSRMGSDNSANLELLDKNIKKFKV